MFNHQMPEKIATDQLSHLDIHSIFLTIQGEGPFAGRKAIFVRLAGCNLQCPGCDTEYTQGRQTLHISNIIEQVYELSPEQCLVVITGGEPFRQDISSLANALTSSRYTVQVQTNGTLSPSSNLDPDVYIVCSPKTGSINKKILKHPRLSLKYVVHADSVDKDDGLPILALDHTARPKVARPPMGFTGNVYIQPMDAQNSSQNRRNLQTAMRSCLKFGYILQLQIHKIIGVD